MQFELAIAVYTHLIKAEAYLDPGSGSFIIQLLIAGLVGAAFFLRSSWGRIKGFFTRSNSVEDDRPDDEE